ncbi:MAG: alpha/beta hydrolase [Hellea sp.]|nr:alpha/beta hydrolase [Hellea sp.]MDG1666174.1 alpha/beta hydrolase [Hellea sp.]
MITIQDWKESGNLISINDYNIFVCDTEVEDKETIILIHGFPTSSWDWKDIWALLEKDYRLIAVDMLGFGFSDKPNPHKYSISEQADIIEKIISDKKLINYHILAHDYGDTVTQEILSRKNRKTSARCESVCFLNGGLFPETHKALLIQKILLSKIGWLVNKLATQKQFNNSMIRVFGPKSKPSKSELDSFWFLINHNKGRHIFHNLISYMSDRKENRERWILALKKSKIPIALINGSIDPVSGSHMIERYKQLIGDIAWLKELKNIGHYPQLEAPEEVSDYYKFFLNNIGQ